MIIAFSTGNDVIIPSVNGGKYLGGGGNDTYVISNLVEAGGTVVITDTEGANTLQLIDGLTISSSTIYHNALQLTLSNGSNVQILGSDDFTYNVGGNILTGTDGINISYNSFVTQSLNSTVPAEGGGFNTGGTVKIDSTVIVVEDYVSVSADIGELTAVASLNASDARYKYVENSNISNCVEISNFSSDDIIEVTKAPGEEYNFTNDGSDVIITLNVNSIVNQITLLGVVDSETLVYDESSFNNAIGFDAFV